MELQPPSTRARLDGRKVEPKQVAHYPSQGLYYIVSPVTYGEDTLQVFVRPEAAAEYLADVERTIAEEPGLLKASRHWLRRPRPRWPRSRRAFRTPIGAHRWLQRHGCRRRRSIRT